MNTIVDRWQDIKHSMQQAAQGAPLAVKAELVAVSKAHSADAILPLLQAGQRVFGENKVQEAEAKWPTLRGQFPDLELHLIGSLQSNKAREALTLFDVIETVDRTSLVDALVKERSKAPARCKQFLVQVNIGEEAQKGGVTSAQLPALLDYCKKNGLPVTGIMCVPPDGENPAPYFALMHKLAKAHALKCLSMGMSGDYETAIRFGATHVRIGTALFGQR